MPQSGRSTHVLLLSESNPYPHVKLRKDLWDDYHFKTLYEATLYWTSSESILLGNVKILDTRTYVTQLPDTPFRVLPPIYISLGQEMAYYKTLRDLENGIYDKILRGLNDVVYNKHLAIPFENLPGFTNSLLRFSEAEKAYKEARQIFYQEPVTVRKFSFAFSCHLENASLNHTATFDFDHTSPLPSRVNAIIGKNGTGKTQFLAHFANTMSGVTRDENKGKFDPERPSFSKIIAISYSAFDSFTKPPRRAKPENRTFSYQYCGLQDSEGFLSLPTEAMFTELFTILQEKRRSEQWYTIMRTMLQETEFQVETPETPPNLDVLHSFSSGQAIVFYILTNIIAHIEEESLLLFDEPELHLHPNAVSNLMRTFYNLLEMFNSYSIVSTHSPLVLREIPSRYVRVFKRIGNVPFVQQLEKECFGENLTIITEEVFQTDESPSNYRGVLGQLARSNTYDDVLSMFDGKLSLNAKIYLRQFYSRKDETL